MGIKKKIFNVENKKYLYFCFFIILSLLIEVWHIRELKQPVVLNDEFGYWGLAASIAGKNWKSLMATTPYYNWGYSILLIPLFYLKLPTYTIYKLAVLFNVILVIGSYCIIVKCAQKILYETNEKILYGIAFVINCYPNVITQSQIAWTETLLYFLYWLAFYTLLLILENKSLKNIIIFSLILSYMFIVHQRTIGILLVGCITVLLLTISKKISVKDLIILLSIIGCALLIGIIIKRGLKTLYWGDSISSQMNDFSGQHSLIEKFFSKSAIKNIGYALSGRCFYFLITGLIIFYSGIRECICKIVICVKKINLKNITFYEFFALFSFMISAAIGLIGILEGFARLDSVVYGRYIENTIGPLLLIGVKVLTENEHKIKKIYIEYIFMIIISGYITLHILSLVNSSEYVDVCSVGLAKFFGNGDYNQAIYQSIIYAIAINGFLIVCMYMKRNLIQYLLLGFIIVANWINSSSYTQEHTIKSYQESKTTNNEQLADYIKKVGVKQLYYVKDDNFDSYCINVKYLQFWIPDVKINVVDNLKKVDRNSIWICEKGNKESSKLIENNLVLNESEELYLCTDISSKYVSALEKKGLLYYQNVDLTLGSSEVSNDFCGEGMKSNGDAGVFFLSQPVKLEEGEYNATALIHNIKNKENSIGKGKFLIKNLQGEIISSIDLSKKIDNLTFSCQKNCEVLFEIVVEKDTKWKLENISFCKISNKYRLGEDSLKNLNDILSKVDQLGITDIYYLLPSKKNSLDLRYIDTKYNVKQIHTTLKIKSNDNYCIFLEKKSSDIFNYLDDYDCVYENTGYVLLINKHSENSGCNTLNNGSFLKSDYFRLNENGLISSDNKVELGQGTYIFRFLTKGLNGNIHFYTAEDSEILDFTTSDNEIEKIVTIKNEFENVSWNCEEINGDFPECFISRIDSACRIIDTPVVVKKDNELELEIANELQMGTYEISFEIKNSNTKNLELVFYKKADVVNKELIKECKNLKQDDNNIFSCKLNILRNGSQEITAVVKNTGQSTVKISKVTIKKLP